MRIFCSWIQATCIRTAPVGSLWAMDVSAPAHRQELGWWMVGGVDNRRLPLPALSQDDPFSDMLIDCPFWGCSIISLPCADPVALHVADFLQLLPLLHLHRDRSPALRLREEAVGPFTRAEESPPPARAESHRYHNRERSLEDSTVCFAEEVA